MDWDFLQTDADHLKSQVGQLQEHNQHLDNQILEIRNSFSWRITRPVRFVSRLVKNNLKPVRTKLVSLCRNIYRRLPLPHETKLLLRSTVFRSATVLGLTSRKPVTQAPPQTPAPDPDNWVVDFSFADVERAQKSRSLFPVYNQLHFTLQCLRSIAQNKPNVSFEIIVADDLSTDKTQEIIPRRVGGALSPSYRKSRFLEELVTRAAETATR